MLHSFRFTEYVSLTNIEAEAKAVISTAIHPCHFRQGIRFDVGPRLSGVSWFSRPGPLFARRSVPCVLAHAQAFGFQLLACTSPTRKAGLSSPRSQAASPSLLLVLQASRHIALTSLPCWPSLLPRGVQAVRCQLAIPQPPTRLATAFALTVTIAKSPLL